jgi:hypothetical protein
VVQARLLCIVAQTSSQDTGPNADVARTKHSGKKKKSAQGDLSSLDNRGPSQEQPPLVKTDGMAGEDRW